MVAKLDRGAVAIIPSLDPDRLTDASGSLLVLYDSPERLLCHSQEFISVERLLASYKEILSAYSSNLRIVSISRLCMLSDADFLAWLSGNSISKPLVCLTPPQPIEAMMTIQILESFPEILDLYLDIELKADLIGDKPDTSCFQRLYDVVESTNLDTMLTGWHEQKIQAAADKKQILDLEHVVRGKNSEITSCYRQLDIVRDEAKQHLHHLMTIQSHLEDSCLEYERLGVLSQELKVNLSSKENELLQVNSQLLSAQDDVTKIKDENKSLHVRINDQSIRSEQYKVKISSLENLIKEFKAKELDFTERCNNLQAVQDEVIRLSKEKQSLNAHLNKKIAEVKELQYKLASQGLDYDGLGNDNAIQLSHLITIQSELESYFSENRKYSHLSKDILTQMERAEEMILSLHDEKLTLLKSPVTTG